jgi:hypothetical protein
MRWRGRSEASASCPYPCVGTELVLPIYSYPHYHPLSLSPPGIHAEVHATLLEAIARPPGLGLGASAFLGIFRELPPELHFYLSELVARTTAEALAIGCGGSELAEDAPAAPLPTGGTILLRHFSPAVCGAALARVPQRGRGPAREQRGRGELSHAARWQSRASML